jgi:4-amino-4-deoxychorismate lyase
MTERSNKSMINGVAADYLNINDRAIHYGDGIFETILCSNNRLYFWQQHYLRLKTSAGKLKLKCPDEKVLLDDISQLLDGNQFSQGMVFSVKIILTRGAGERGYRFASDRFDIACVGTRLVLLSEISPEYSSLITRELISGELCLCRQQASINTGLAGIKHLNRLENVLARNEWNDEYLDGLMINASSHVIEGSMSNIFAVKHNQLFTPELSLSGVKGIMRDVVIQLAEKNNIPISLTRMSVDEIVDMDELFISNSLIGMKSVNKLLDTRYTTNTISLMIFNDLLQITDSHVQTV